MMNFFKKKSKLANNLKYCSYKVLIFKYVSF